MGQTFLTLVTVLALAAGATETNATTGTVTGVVRDEGGPVAGATVRVQGTTVDTRTGADGKFVLDGLVQAKPLTLSAWAEGYYSSRTEGVVPPSAGLEIRLRRYQTDDNPGYRWLSPRGEVSSCSSCKTGVLEVWLDQDAHGKSATNKRFLTMYNGSDVDGNQSPPTRFVSGRDYGNVPLPPDPTKPYFGPGYKLDFPATAGACAACHTPGAAVNTPYGTDPNKVQDADTFGVHCDFCHKVADVRLDAATGLPFPNMPGVLSMDIRRPFPDDPERPQLFFGTFDDPNVSDGDTYLPLLKESRYCAPCHSAVFWDTKIYSSYDEWLASPYSDPSYGGAKTCQQCHMPTPTVVGGLALTNVAPGKGGIERDPRTINAHSFPGASSVELMRSAVTMKVATDLGRSRLQVEVSVTNDGTGHHVPTDSPLRHLILLVRATGQGRAPLLQLEGSRVPQWGGVGDPARGYYAGLPGKAFAKVLKERWTELSPSGAYWNPTRVVSDNRLAALASDVSAYVFAAPPDGALTVTVTLLFRRAFRPLADLKRWNDPDIVMAERRLVVRRGRWPNDE